MNLKTYTPDQLSALVAFLNQELACHRHWSPISEADFHERVLDQPVFDPRGLILAWEGDRLVGGVHALRPPEPTPLYRAHEPRHTIAWLAVTPDARRHGIGGRLLEAAQDYLYYCPVYFAGHAAPLYGIIEKLWVPWYGSTERMGLSAVDDKEPIEWLRRRGYQVVRPGDVSMMLQLGQDRPRPQDPGLAAHGLHVDFITQRSPWTGDEPFYRLRGWGQNGGREYHGLVVSETDAAGENRAGGEHAVGTCVWYPLPDQETAALALFGVDNPYRGLRFGSYLLDRALVEMANRGYLCVEVHVHTKEHLEGYAMFRRRGFQVVDYWVNLVKT